jgi:hypothetical protein
LTNSGEPDIVPDLAINHFTEGNAMTPEQVEIFVEVSPSIVIDEDLEKKVLKFRDVSLLKYQNDLNYYTEVPYDVMLKISEDQLMKAIQTGLRVDGITRITGYMSKTSQWNDGKKAELKDRRKFEVTESGCNSACPVSQGG